MRRHAEYNFFYEWMIADQLHINEIRRLFGSPRIERRRAMAEKRYAQPQLQQYRQPQRSQSSTQLLGREQAPARDV